MEKRPLADLLTEAIELHAQRAAAWGAAAQFRNTTKAPARPRVVTSVEEWAAYEAAADEYNSRKAWIDQRARATEKAVYCHVAALIAARMPTEIWFRHGDHAVGISYTNWGGNKYGLEVEPYRERLPSLNHRYSGD